MTERAAHAETVRPAPTRGVLRRWAVTGQVVILLVITAGMSWLLTANFDVRLANITRDDDPAFYARYAQDPTRFTGDFVASYASAVVRATLQNWLPALLLIYAGIPPEPVSRAFVFAQHMLLGVALFYFARKVTARDDVVWLTVFFDYATDPFRWNLANYGGLSTAVPYAGFLVLPFTVFAGGAALAGHPLRTALLLIVAGLIHPPLALYTAFFIGIFWCWQARFRPSWRLAHQLIPLGVSVASCVLPALLAQASGGAKVTTEELMFAVRLNYHFTPWQDTAFFAYLLPMVLGGLALTGLALREPDLRTHPVRHFWLSCLVGCGVLAVINLVGVLVGVPRFAQLAPLRSTLLLALFSLPVQMLYLARHIQGPVFGSRWLAAWILVFVATLRWPVYWTLLIVLAAYDLCAGRFGRPLPIPNVVCSRLRSWPWAALLVAGVSVAGPGVSLIPDAPFGGPHDLSLGSRQYLGLVAMLGLAESARILSPYVRGRLSSTGAWRHSRVGAWLVSAGPERLALHVCFLVVVLMAISVYRDYEKGHATAQTALWSNYEAQVWARDNTPPDATFIIYRRGWRTISQRRAIDPRINQGYIYSDNRGAKQFDDAYLAFYGLAERARSMSADELFGAILAAYRSLGPDGLRRLAQRFGGDYVVQPADDPLDLPVAYRNAGVVVYSVR